MGATGDLSRRKLLPGLFYLSSAGFIPSCRIIGLFDGAAGPLEAEATVRLDSGLPEELTPLTLAVLGQLLAHRVALALKIDPDRPRALNKVTRTW